MSEETEDIPVRVALRCRPLISKEKAEGCQTCLHFTHNRPQVVIGKNKAFTYDFVFGSETKQETVYTSAVAPLVNGIFKGYNATVLAYGQTGSGKTYSMGSGSNLTDLDTIGIIPRVIKDLFDGIAARSDTEFLLKCSYLEIHKEDINDLLNLSLKKEMLSVREDPEGGIKVWGLQEVVVTNAFELEQCLEQGSIGRSIGSTAMNAQSSRSHAILTITVEMRKKDDSDNYCHAKFHLVDLAGSERIKKTRAEGERLKEGININRGLLALGNVISTLGDENGRKGHVPYRDSKLTRLLQDALGGNSQTLMLACVSPADSNMEETLNTLRYADRARQIKNKPIVNTDPQAAELIKLKQQVQQLQVQLLQSKSINGGTIESGSLEGSADVRTLLERNQMLETANNHLTLELQTAIDQTTLMCEKAILVEMSRDKLKQRLEELKEQMNISIGNLDLTLGEGDKEKAAEQLDLIRQLQNKIVHLETEDKLNAVETLYENAEGKETPEEPGSTTSEDTTSPAAVTIDMTQHTLRQAQLGRELQDLNKALALKQDLVHAMGQNDEKMTVMKMHYENNMRDMESEIATLQKERETLSSALHAVRSTTTTNKVSEQRRLRLQELSSEITKMKKKLTEQSKLIKLKQKSDHTVTKLNTDIQSMKQARVRLMKQLKEEGDKYRQWKAEKDKEVLQLKAKDRKRQCEFSKLTQKHEKHENVLRRKMAEAAAVNKRLKEALDKQKVSQQKHKSQDLTSEEKTMVGAAKRIKSWLDHELEVMVSVNEAKRHLGSLLADRKALTKQLHQLEEEGNTEPPHKKKITRSKSVDLAEDGGIRQQRIAELQQELEMRNAQITDLQQKIVDADQEEKGHQRWNRITSMVEAKCGLKWLLETCVLAKVATSATDSNLKNLQDIHNETTEKVQRLEEEMTEMKTEQERGLTQMQRVHEDKVLYLLTQLSQLKEDREPTTPSVDDNCNDLKMRIKFQDDQIRELSSLHEQLQETEKENDDLHKQLTMASYSGKKQSLMPAIVSPSPSSSPDEDTPVKPRRGHRNEMKPPLIERYTLNEILESESEAEVSNDDSDWHLTPYLTKPKKVPTAVYKKKRCSDRVGCGCPGYCKSKVCSCVRTGISCGENCRCKQEKCCNKDNDEMNEDQSEASTSSVLMNTTVVISGGGTSSTGLKRSTSLEMNAADSSADDFTLSSRRSNLPGKLKRSVSIDVENQGVVKRKRKLLSTSSASMFFKPLTDD